MYREIDEQLQEWKVSKNRKPLILSGARQVGKTYSLQEFGKNHFKQCHYLNLEKLPDLQDVFEGNLRPDSIVKEIELRLGKRIDVNSDLVVLDEIQAIPNALTSLKYFAEDLPQLAICSAGSLLGIQLNEQSFPVGKTDRLWLGPLKFKEFLTAFGRTLELEAYKDALRENIITLNAHKVLQEHFRLFSTIGGLPEVVRTFMEYQQNFQEGLQKTREKQLTILKDYYDDIAKHSGKVNAFDITRVLSSIPMQLGRNIEDGASKFTFKNVLPGKSNYQTLCNPIEWLVRAGLIYKINIANVTRTFHQPFCCVCESRGILNSCARPRPQIWQISGRDDYRVTDCSGSSSVLSSEDSLSCSSRTIRYLSQRRTRATPITVNEAV
jgi:predicted AAA+ superfamily ATPase